MIEYIMTDTIESIIKLFNSFIKIMNGVKTENFN